MCLTHSSLSHFSFGSVVLHSLPGRRGRGPAVERNRPDADQTKHIRLEMDPEELELLGPGGDTHDAGDEASVLLRPALGHGRPGPGVLDPGEVLRGRGHGHQAREGVDPGVGGLSHTEPLLPSRGGGGRGARGVGVHVRHTDVEAAGRRGRAGRAGLGRRGVGGGVARLGDLPLYGYGDHLDEARGLRGLGQGLRLRLHLEVERLQGLRPQLGLGDQGGGLDAGLLGEDAHAGPGRGRTGLRNVLRMTRLFLSLC